MKYANQKYLDSILKAMLENGEKLISYKSLVEIVEFDDKEVTLLYFDPSERMTRALMFLNNKELIFQVDTQNFQITFDGVIFVENGGFEQEVRDNKYKSRLNNFSWLWSPIAGLLSVLIALAALFISLSK